MKSRPARTVHSRFQKKKNNFLIVCIAYLHFMIYSAPIKWSEVESTTSPWSQEFCVLVPRVWLAAY